MIMKVSSIVDDVLEEYCGSRWGVVSECPSLKLRTWGSSVAILEFIPSGSNRSSKAGALAAESEHKMKHAPPTKEMDIDAGGGRSSALAATKAARIEEKGELKKEKLSGMTTFDGVWRALNDSCHLSEASRGCELLVIACRAPLHVTAMEDKEMSAKVTSLLARVFKWEHKRDASSSSMEGGSTRVRQAIFTVNGERMATKAQLQLDGKLQSLKQLTCGPLSGAPGNLQHRDDESLSFLLPSAHSPPILMTAEATEESLHSTRSIMDAHALAEVEKLENGEIYNFVFIHYFMTEYFTNLITLFILMKDPLRWPKKLSDHVYKYTAFESHNSVVTSVANYISIGTNHDGAWETMHATASPGVTARLLMGPILGSVTSTSCIIMLEVDHGTTCRAVLQNVLDPTDIHEGNACFDARTPNSITVTNLKPLCRYAYIVHGTCQEDSTICNGLIETRGNLRFFISCYSLTEYLSNLMLLLHDY